MGGASWAFRHRYFLVCRLLILSHRGESCLSTFLMELRFPQPRAHTHTSSPTTLAETAYARGGIVFNPGDTVVDAGANIGMFTLYAASRCAGNASIYSFEPIPSTYEVLAANANSAMAGEYDTVFKPAKGAKLKITGMHLRGFCNVVFI